MTEPVLRVRGLRTEVPGPDGPLAAVDGISFDVRAGETLVLLGESGSGKSLTALSIMRLLPDGARVTGGEVMAGTQNLLALTEAQMRAWRGRRVAMIFQEPMTALNPVLTAGEQIAEALRRHGHGRAQAWRGAVDLIGQMGIADAARRATEYPHQLSGGMRQRVMIAMALAGEPDVLIADEPTTALDVTTQAQILDLLRTVQARRGMGLLLVTHDLGVAAMMADQVAVMQRGKLVETAAREEFFRAPQHPYSRALFAALPDFARRAVRVPAPDPAPAAAPVLEVTDLRVHFRLGGRLLGRRAGAVRAVDGVSVALPAGRTLAIVGESGCGKSTLARAAVRLLTPTSGQVRFEGTDLARLRGRALRHARRHFQIVFQDPYGSLNPRMRACDIIAEGLDAQGIGTPAERRARVAELLGLVGLPADAGERYPHEFSGGQRQRISIARALAPGPRVVVLDEPTSALDLSVQGQILDLLVDLQQRLGLAYLLVTHNVGVVEYLAHTIAVMYLGRVVEHGPVPDVLRHPAHPYTQTLLAAVPRVDTAVRVAGPAPTGEPPSPTRPPPGCAFHPRCASATAVCREIAPVTRETGAAHTVACHHPLAP